MEVTGERYIPIPGVSGQSTNSFSPETTYEHLHRYALAHQFVVGRAVLDIASGEGYGSALLADVAKSVVGVDVDPEAVAHARTRYGDHQNVTFTVGSCDAVPLPDGSVDIVTSFETLEHHDKHDEMMREVRRVLTPGGLLIISSPNRPVYSGNGGRPNPYHVKELDLGEFAALLARHFPHSRLYGQRLATASFIVPVDGVRGNSLTAYTGDVDCVTSEVIGLDNPVYFVGLCSDDLQAVSPPVGSYYLNNVHDLMALSRDRARSDVQYVEDQLRRAERTITEMQNSSFWKLRNAWFHLRGRK